MPVVPSRRTSRQSVAAGVLLALTWTASAWAADTDIYGPSTSADASPNVVFLLDNTSNWSANSQAWSTSSVTAKCNALTDAAQRATCLDYTTRIFGAASSLTQGQLQLRALKLVLNELVCTGATTDLKVNVGLALIGTQSTLSSGHAVGLINFAVQALTGTAASGSCKTIMDRLDLIDSKITDPAYKAPSNANYGAPYYEIFKYYGGHTNPTLAGNPAPNGASPTGATAYGPVRYSTSNTLDDRDAFTSGARTTYTSPITSANSCGGNYVVLVGNTYPNVEPSNGGPTVFSGLGYTPPALSSITSDTSRFADEWAYFLANTDVSKEAGIQRVFTYAINTYNDKPDPDQGKLLKSMANVGGIGPSAYLEVGGDLYALVKAFRDVLSKIAAVNSVFTATTLPVSTTTQGTFLNQVFVGTFRPDAYGQPRWVGNLKQFELGLLNGKLGLVDKNKASAVLSGAGFFSPTAQSYWTEDSVFFDQKPSGTPASRSDNPDGAIVEKGGAAQQLRKTYLGSTSLNTAANRNVKTVSGPTGPLVDFTTASGFTAAEVAWIRGANNVTSGAGMESFAGSYDNSGTPTVLGATGARHSIHGDVLHSRPVALNYGSGNVIVYYGANDGFFRAVDGRKTGSTAGQELWSFIAPEHYPLLKRLRDGSPSVQLPETDKTGATIKATGTVQPRTYGMDGPIGVYALYDGSATVSQAFIYPTMRRGGRSVYAFDVSNKTAPVFKWTISNSSAGFTELGQTWSMPKPVVTTSATATDPILIMGGGYDDKEDLNATSSPKIGNRIYIINGNTGALIKALSTDYAVPSDVTVVDVDGDGNPDRVYVADVRGGLYRVDFPSGALTASASWSSTTAVKIADVGGKVFFAPDVVVTKAFVAVLVGTGDREKPLLVSTADKFVLVKDNVGAPRASVLGIGDLTRVAKVDNASMALSSVVAGVNDPEGCYLELATNGEKVVNTPFTIAGATYFGTNRPTPTGTNSCTADLGEAYSYKFPLFCGVPGTPQRLVGGGLPPSPVGGIVTIDVNGVPTQMPFLIGGSGPSVFDVDEPKPPIPPIRTRQSWRIDNGTR